MPRAIGQPLARGAAVRVIVLAGVYLLTSLLFTGIYWQTTETWTEEQYRACAEGFNPDEVYSALFRGRVLVPLLARAAVHATRARYSTVFMAITVLSVFLLFVAYRQYLSNFMRPPLADVLCLAIAYPLLWNYCLLSTLYYPFDIPSVLLFVLGCHFLYRRDWLRYYPTLAVAITNRDVSGFLIVAFLVCMVGSMPPRRLAGHLLAQAALSVGVLLLLAPFSGARTLSFLCEHLLANLRTVIGMVTFAEASLRDWGKLLLAFGGTWLALPFILRHQPHFIRRSLVVAVPLLVAAWLWAVIDEVRQYGELIPLVLTPVIYSAAEYLAGTGSSPARASHRLGAQ
ncbi:hypothetical protein KAW64_11755 [bacterium]|nr:hypothetical protein [bacterium]